MMKLTRGQRRVLHRLQYDPEADLAFEKGAGWWVKWDRTNGRLAQSLVRAALVKLESGSEVGVMERYMITNAGKRALVNLPPYRDANGQYHDNLEDIRWTPK